MQLTNERIQAILDGAPEGATHVDPDGDYWAFYEGNKYLWTNTWDFCCADYPLRDLDDLREILQLRQEVEKLRELLKLIQIEGGLGIARHRQIDRALAAGE